MTAPDQEKGAFEPGRTRSRLLTGRVARRLARRFFAAVTIDAAAAESVRGIAKHSSIVYVVRYRSLFDFHLVTAALDRAGLPVPEFAPGLRHHWRRSWPEIARRWLHAFGIGAPPPPTPLPAEEREHCRRLVEAGRPILLFIRSRAAGVAGVAREPGALGRARAGADYLREIVIHQWNQPARVSFVPLAIVRGRGYRRKESKLATLVYTVRQAPGEIRRLLSFLWNRHDTSVVVGRDVQLDGLIERYRGEGAERIARRLSRALQIFLYREERMVQGPTLLPKAEVRRIVMGDPSLQRYIERTAWATRQSRRKLQRTARRHFDGMAANYQSIYVSLFEVILNRLWGRMFSDIRWSGIERVADKLRQHPIVLVPCHRSHLDYLLLSYIFHRNHLSPPHIAAGDNLAFWPLGPLFRGAGAFFLRRSFGDDELYKRVFRAYLGFLIREGYTQEFFLEGGRSRSGKLLTAKLGILSAIVDVFLRGARRELYLVPVSIQYTRIVEEQAYRRELEGAAKERESLGALLRARRVLEQTYGEVEVTFAEPISLRNALGPEYEALRTAVREVHTTPSAARLDERRRLFVEGLAQTILRSINAASTVNATAVAATALLSADTAALRYRDFLDRARQLLRILEALDAPLAGAFDFGATRHFLESAGLLRRIPEVPDVLHVPAEHRRSLDFYKNNAIHWFLLPALFKEVTAATSTTGEALVPRLALWLDLYRLEFPTLPTEAVAGTVARLEEFRRNPNDAPPAPADPLAVTHGILASFHEPYWMVADVLLRLEAAGVGEKTLLERIQKRYQAAFLLGETRKVEGNSTITIRNAIERFRIAACVQVETRQGRIRGRERWYAPGPARDWLAAWRNGLESVVRRRDSER